MSTLYVESSALLCWLFGEADGSRARESMNGADALVTSTLTVVEAQRAILRAETEQLVSAKDAQALRGLLRQTLAGWTEMEMTEEVRERASRPFTTEPVRTLDAIHLATALEFAQAFPEIGMLSFDQRIRDNAEALGLQLVA